MGDKSFIVTFGMQARHIEAVENRLRDYNPKLPGDDIWTIIGRDIGWEPKTIRDKYVEYLSQHKRKAIQTESELEIKLFERANEIVSLTKDGQDKDKTVDRLRKLLTEESNALKEIRDRYLI